MLSDDDLVVLLRRGLVAERAVATDEALAYLASRASGDGRQALTTLEVAVALAAAERTDDTAVAEVTLTHAEGATDLKALRYGRDEHYDIISAFIKSIRGSDPDAGLYWLARMLAAGEDARFIARRLVVLASEDVGMGDPLALGVATAAAQAVDFVGLPEARINLAHAVVHLATAPKSNAAYVGLNRAMADVERLPAGEVPLHLRDASYRGAASLGHGEGYIYPHNYDQGWALQQYRPDEVAQQRYYEPTSWGYEARVMARLAEIQDRQTDENAGRPPSPRGAS
ncbi:MAG: hypothetical protein R2706_12915 [Acidimicrobiales bacterium]